MAQKPTDYIYDGCLDFPMGIDSGSAPQSLSAKQCAFATNVTYRGNYATNRPPVRRVKVAADIDALLQDAFTAGLFQGATSYKPDFAPEQLTCSIGGRQFVIQPSTDPDIDSTGSEITIPGDPNPGNIAPVWIEQAEQFLIFQDGKSIPIFYDGVSSRRSETTVNAVGVFAAGPYTVPPIGGFVDVTLVANFTGLLNSVLRLDELGADGNVRKSANYMVVKMGGNVAQYEATIKNLTATPTTIYSEGNTLVVQPSNLGNVKTVSPAAGPDRFTVSLTAPIPAYVVKGMAVLINGNSYSVFSVSHSFTNMTITGSPSSVPSPTVGSNVTLKNYNAANVTIGILDSPATAPAVDSNVTVFLQTQMVFPDGTVFFIGNDQYQLVSSIVNPPAANTSVRLQNLNDNADLDLTQSPPAYFQLRAGSTLYNLPELPIGRMFTYGMGRVWLAGQNGVSFLAGDIVNGSSGSPAYGGRDAVLKVNENTFLAGGGLFSIPSSGDTITAMAFTATLDTSLGQGALQVFTNRNVFSCTTPADRTVWQSLTNPILTQALKGSGAASHWAVTNSNADILFRSPDAQLRSLILARLDFNHWGNTPISFEVTRIIEAENEDFMNFCSAIEFDNRWLVTTNPEQGTQGVFWPGLAVINFDPISTLQTKESSIYEGLWTGLNILKLVKFQSVPRAFAFCVNIVTNQLEIWELLASGSEFFDDGTNPIPSTIETPMLFHNVKTKSVFDLLKLEDGEIYVSNVIGRVDFKIQYRSDFDTCWHDWRSWFICAGQGTDSTATNPQYRNRMGFGQPTFDADCNINTNRPPMYGTMFQLRIAWTGQCVINGFRVAASLQPIPKCAEPVCNV